MLIVKVELWPGGDKRRAREIGRIELANTGTHAAHPKRGDYVVKVMRRGSRAVQWLGAVRDYPREAYPVWELVRRALNEWGRRRLS